MFTIGKGVCEMATGIKKLNTPNVLTFSVDSFVGSEGKPYYVQIFPWGGESCTCPDYVFRKRATGERCKHIKAVVHGIGGANEGISAAR